MEALVEAPPPPPPPPPHQRGTVYVRTPTTSHLAPSSSRLERERGLNKNLRYTPPPPTPQEKNSKGCFLSWFWLICYVCARWKSRYSMKTNALWKQKQRWNYSIKANKLRSKKVKIWSHVLALLFFQLHIHLNQTESLRRFTSSQQLSHKKKKILNKHFSFSLRVRAVFQSSHYENGLPECHDDSTPSDNRDLSSVFTAVTKQTRKHCAQTCRMDKGKPPQSEW